MKKINFSSLFLIFAFSATALAANNKLRVEVFAAKTSSVNSFVFSDSVGTLIVDATRNSKEATEVAQLAKKYGKGPQIIFITHGHPDHYLGMGALKKEFPTAQIFVASQKVKDDIIAFAQLAAQNHWLDDEPLMSPKSQSHPDGFDYKNEIQVLSDNTLTLPGGEKLEVLTDFPATEAAHETLLFSKELNSLFASDLVYNNVHLWLGNGVDAKAIENWQLELKKLKSKYSQQGLKVYPGHGSQTDSKIFDTDIKYMNDFLVAVNKSKTQEEATATVIQKYPGWENTNFLLVQSIKNQFKLLKK